MVFIVLSDRMTVYGLPYFLPAKEKKKVIAPFVFQRNYRIFRKHSRHYQKSYDGRGLRSRLRSSLFSYY